MNYGEWSNFTAVGYLKYALEDYNRIASRNDNDYRPLTEDEQKRIISSMRYSFDMKTLKEAYEKA